MEFVRDAQIVARAERLFAQLAEREARDALGGFRHADDAALDGDLHRLAGERAGEALPRHVERDLGVLVGRHVPDGLAGELLQPEVLRRLEPHHLHLLAQQRDEGQEQRAIEPVLVELVRLDVRGRDHDDAVARTGA